MALVIEDGTGVAEADSFVSAASIVAFAAKRGIVITLPEAEVHAIKAMDYFFTLCLIGEVAFPGVQWTLYPRKGLIAGDEEPGFGYEIPRNVILAQLHLAVDSFNGIDLVPSRAAEPKLKKRKTGPIEREYFEGVDFLPDLPMIDALMNPLKCGQGFKLRTYRA
jgi:hypothetical protein